MHTSRSSSRFTARLLATALVLATFATAPPRAGADPPPRVVAMALGPAETLALKSDGSVWTWGRDSFATPVQVAGLAGITAIASGGRSFYALQGDGSVWAWGGELTLPTGVPGLHGITAIAAGHLDTAYALRRDGTVWAWGEGYWGQLGNNTARPSPVPVQVAGLTGVRAIAAGGGIALAIKTDGTLWAWGRNDHGQLGIGTREGPEGCTLPDNTSTVCAQTPVQVHDIEGVTEVRVHDTTVYARTALGRWWAWGSNNEGILADGTTNTANLVPQQTTQFLTIRTLIPATEKLFGLDHQGRVWALGHNYGGGLGIGAPAAYATRTPVVIPGLSGVIALYSGFATSFALTADGRVWAWGQNLQGNLGIGARTGPELCEAAQSCAPTPVLVWNLSLPDVQVLVNDVPVVADTSPVLTEDRVLVPLRAVAEAMGASVGWDGATGTVHLGLGPTGVRLRIGSNTAFVNDQAVRMDVPAVVLAGRTLVPVRFVAEALGAAVSWDGATRSVLIWR